MKVVSNRQSNLLEKQEISACQSGLALQRAKYQANGKPKAELPEISGRNAKPPSYFQII